METRALRRIKLHHHCDSPRVFNPTALVHADKVYILFRCESAPLSPPLRGPAAWGNSTTSYWLEAYDHDIRPAGIFHRALFKTGHHSYESITRKDSSERHIAFEDLRFISGIAPVANKDGQLCAYCSYNACVRYDIATPSRHVAKVGICRVNLHNGVIEHCFFLETNPPSRFEKNWGIWKAGGKHHLLYSIDPKILVEANDLHDLTVNKDDSVELSMDTRISTNPVAMEDGRQLFLVHRKQSASDYSFHPAVSLPTEGSEPEIRVGRKPLLSMKSLFCCSLLILPSHRLYILGGHKDATPVLLGPLNPAAFIDRIEGQRQGNWLHRLWSAQRR